jgi:hypothetical protein
MKEHDLKIVQLTADRQNILLCQCVCGGIAGPKAGAKWTITDNGDGTIALSPSVDWSEGNHFHDFFAHVAVGKVDVEAYYDSAQWAIDHPEIASS